MEVYQTIGAFHRQMNEIAKKTNTPINGNFELTNRCTLNCHFCYVHTLDADMSAKTELTTEQWEQIFQDAIDAGMMFATLSGGECLLRKDFKELYCYLYDRGVVVRVKTNGTLLTEDHISFFLKYRPEGIDITLYGSNEDVYASVCGVPAYERVMNNIRRLIESKIPLMLSLTFSKRNYEDRIKLFEQIRDLDTPYQIMDWLISPREGDCMTEGCLSNEDRVQIAIGDWTNRGWKRYECRETAPEPGGSCSTVKKGFPCSAGRCSFSVTYNGDLTPCFTIPGISVSLLTHSFSDAWKEVCKKTAELLQPLECDGCAYEKACMPCLAIRSGSDVNGHRNPEVCDYMQKKYLAGLIPPLGE